MKPNTICKYSKCKNGQDGGRKHYYACVYCLGTENWKAMACCKEHYDLYIKEVLANREPIKGDDLLPDRTDMTKEEIKKVKMKPLSQLASETKEELKDYADENGEININEAVDKVNAEIDSKTIVRKRNKK